MNLDEKEVVKAKMYAITTLSVIGVIIIIIIAGYLSIKSYFDSLFTTKTVYFVLNVDDSNRDRIIELFANEKENIYNQNYCDSIYKIEYHHLFPDGTDYTMYCKDEENISFSIDKVGEDTLATYIHENGMRETR